MPIAITARTTGIHGTFNERKCSSSAIHANANRSRITANTGNFLFAILN